MKRSAFVAFALLAPLLATKAYAATPRCVSSDAELATALSDAQFIPLDIQLVQRTYHLDNTIWHNATTPIRIYDHSNILGGYTAGCNSRTIAVGNTIWRDDTPAPAGDGPLVFNALLFEGITFSLPLSFKANVSAHSNPSLTIRRSAVLGGGSIDFSQADDLEDPGGTFTATVENTLVAGNNYGGSGCGLGVVTLKGYITLFVINSTIVDNQGSGGVCAYSYGGEAEPAILELYNNIIWNNSGADIVNNTSATQLVDNIYHTRNFPPPGFSPVGTLDVNPQLQGDYHLSEPTSPAIDTGTSNVPGGLPPHDLDGGPRVIGVGVDRGAFESSINKAFVQTVINKNDSGTGSLRQAMLNSIANGSGLIGFNIGTGCGPHVITLQSELPDITVPLLLLGYSQIDAAKNSLDYGFDAKICIVIKAANSNVQYAFRVPTGAPANAQVIIEGFDFGGFGTAPVVLRGGTAHGISGNRFGVINGGAEDPDPYDVFIGSGVSGVLIGGADSTQRNLILTATTAGVWLDDGTTVAANHNQIVNNYIGFDWGNGRLTAHGNTGDGLHVRGYANTITDNLIGYSGGDGVQLAGKFAHNNNLTGNTIGGISISDGNGGNGVTIQGDANDNQIVANTIDYNALRGVRVVNGLRNRISKNYIGGNGALGIDLADVGVTGIDDDSNPPLPDYANRGQNFPILSDARGGRYSGQVSGTLITTPGDYKVEIFGTFSCDTSNHGEGAPFIVSHKVTVPLPASGNQNSRDFTIAISAPGQPLLSMPPFITATATDAVGDTSEFSLCIPYIDDTIFADGFE